MALKCQIAFLVFLQHGMVMSSTLNNEIAKIFSNKFQANCINHFASNARPDYSPPSISSSLFSKPSTKLDDHYRNLDYFAVIVTRSINMATISAFFDQAFRKQTPHLEVFVSISNTTGDSYAIYHQDPIKLKISIVDIFGNGAFLKSGKRLFPRIPINLNGQFYKAATFILPPFTYKNPDQTGLVGFEIRTFNIIAEIMNFNFNISMVKGTWNGLVDHLHNERATFGWAHFFLTESRKKLIDFTESFDTDNYCFFMALPKELPNWYSIILPLSWRTWIAVVIGFLFCVVFIWIYTSTRKQPEFTTSEGLIFIIAAFLDENTEVAYKLRSHTIKVFSLPFLLAVMTLTAGYRGSLVSFLTAPIHQKPMETLQEVVDSPFTVASIGNVIKKDLHKAPEELYQRFDDKYVLYSKLNLTMDMAFEEAAKRKLIVYENRQMEEFRKRRDFTNKFGESNVHIAKECSKQFNICFGLPKNHVLTMPMGEVIVMLKESGIIGKFFKDEMDSVARVDKKKSVTETPSPLTLNHLQGAFIVLVVFIIISILGFAIETWIFFMKRGGQLGEKY